jgi:hypothetical protein
MSSALAYIHGAVALASNVAVGDIDNVQPSTHLLQMEQLLPMR